MQQLNRELLRVGRTMAQIERQQRRLSAASATGDALKANRMALYGRGQKPMRWPERSVLRSWHQLKILFL